MHKHCTRSRPGTMRASSGVRLSACVAARSSIMYAQFSRRSTLTVVLTAVIPYMTALKLARAAFAKEI